MIPAPLAAEHWWEGGPCAGLTRRTDGGIAATDTVSLLEGMDGFTTQEEPAIGADLRHGWHP